MPLEMVLNELSLRPASSVIEAHTRMKDLIETIRQATKRRISRALRTDRDLNDIELAAEYPVRRWRNDPEVDLEAKRFFRSLTSQAPYFANVPVAAARASGMDCFFCGERANGLLAAYLLDSLAVSLGSDRQWEDGAIQVDIEELIDNEIQTTREELRHASDSKHIELHHNWIMQRTRLPDPRDGTELWAQCTERYPQLLFCAAVEQHLEHYLSGNEALVQIMKRLSAINHYVGNWKEGAFDANSLGSNVTPESQATLNQYAQERTFLCPDGVKRVFSWHARFPPGERRLYFYPDSELRTITIGYIGAHLRTVLFN